MWKPEQIEAVRKVAALTDAQHAWFAEHPNYQIVGPPRPGVKFIECGTLYANGQFEKMESMKPVRLEAGCKCVGIKVHPET